VISLDLERGGLVAEEPAPRAPVHRRLGLLVRQNVPALVMAAVVAGLVLPPLISVIYSSFSKGNTVWSGPRSLEHYRVVLGESSGFAIVKNTFVFAAGSALLGVALAAVVALLVERTNAPFRRFVYFTVVVSFAVPTVIQTMGWILLMGPNGSFVNQTVRDALGGIFPTIDLYTMSGMIFVQATVLFPALFLLIAPTFRSADPALEHQASVAGGNRLLVMRRVTLPLAAPSMLAAALLGFIVGIESFEVPALLGTPSRIRVLSTAIFSRVQGFEPDFGSAAAFSSLLMLLTIGGVVLYQRATARAHKFATVTGKGYRPDKIALGPLRWIAGVVTFVVPLFVLGPLLILAWASILPFYTAPSFAQFSTFTLDNYRSVISSASFRESLRTSLLLGVGAALLVMAVTLVVAWTIVRRRNALSRGLDFVATLPLVIPGVVLSLAVLRTYINFPIAIYGTAWIILLAFVIHYLPYGLRYNHAGMVSLHRELEEAAEVGGAGRISVFLRVVVPLMRPALVAGGLFVFLASVRQLSVVIFLVGPRVNVVSSSVFGMWNIGSFTDAATASMVVVIVVLVIAAVVYRLSGLGKQGGLAASFHMRR
jgi:iron(III) transport system permease protein